MSIGNSLLNFFKLDSEEDEYDDYDDYDYNEPEEPVRPSRRAQQPKPRSYSRDVEDEPQARPRTGFLGSGKKVVSLNRAMSEIKLYQLTGDEDSSIICDTILEGKPVIVNFEGLDFEAGQRILDFICGCVYAIDGNYQIISNSIYIFSPNGVDIVGTNSDSTEDNGVGHVPTLSKSF